LPSDVRADLEPKFGADFSGVKVHTGSTAAQLSQDVGAQAFTHGSDIYFNQGKYNPESGAGKHLLAHELTHTVQQGGSESIRSKPMVQHGRSSHQIQRDVGVNQQAANKFRVEISKVTQEFVTLDHALAIQEACKKGNLILSVRETGKLSVDRIGEGAKAKPHTILEKSIKQSSMAGLDPRQIEQINAQDIKGFVGAWGKNPQKKELLGVRIDGWNKTDTLTIEHKELLTSIVVNQNGIEYVPLDKIDTLKSIPIWKTLLYTGDYDLHELYKNNRQLGEMTEEKRKALSLLNKKIGEKDVTRGGEFERGEDGALHQHNPYAMIQHGDQATYVANQYNEARENNEETATIVGAVGSESPDPLAWCDKRNWYITKNKEEHQAFRMAKKLIKPHVWTEEGQKSLRNRKRAKVI